MSRAALALAVAAAACLAFSIPEREWRAQIRSTLFIPEPLPSLAPVAHGMFEPAAEVVAERVSYGTQFGLRVPAVVYRPKSTGVRRPALIVVNGHGGDKYSWYAFYAGMLYAGAGAVVLTYDPIGEGERNAEHRSGTRAHDRLVPPPEMARRLAGLMITDVSQAVSYLAQRPDVDARRIAAVGYSMGSFVLGVACAVETRLRACVLVGGGNLDGPGEYWDSSKPMCQGLPYRSLQFLDDRPAALYALHASRGPTLIFNGLKDSVVDIPVRHEAAFFEALRRRTIALRGSPKDVFEFSFEPGASHRPFFLGRPVALWLERHLDFPNWTVSAVEKMPETHIGQWARARDVPMDPLYSSEEREGGLRALGTGLPGIARERLDVFPREQWERDKRRFVLETWIEEARARLTRQD